MDKKIALISDVHSNLVALEAVLADIKDQSVDEIFFLGDAIGYGVRPNECIELIRENCSYENCIMGNHESGFLNSIEFFSVYSREMLEWTRKVLTAENTEWISGLAKQFNFKEVFFVHGSPYEPDLYHYLGQWDLKRSNENLDKNFSKFSNLCFIGHSHIPFCICYDNEDSGYEYLSPKENNNRFLLGEEKVVINVGSVGQPRDKDPRSCYVIWQDDVISWHRIKYDIEKVVEDFESIGEDLPVFEAQRLLEGR